MEFLLRSTSTCNSRIMRGIHCQCNAFNQIMNIWKIGNLRVWVVVMSSCFLLACCNCVRCERHPSPDSQHLSPSPHILARATGLSYLSSQLITWSRKKADILHLSCLSWPTQGRVEAGVETEKREIRSQQCPWLWGLACQQWIIGRENCPSVPHSVLTQSTFPTQNRDPVFCYCKTIDFTCLSDIWHGTIGKVTGLFISLSSPPGYDKIWRSNGKHFPAS